MFFFLSSTYSILITLLASTSNDRIISLYFTYFYFITFTLLILPHLFFTHRYKVKTFPFQLSPDTFHTMLLQEIAQDEHNNSTPECISYPLLLLIVPTNIDIAILLEYTGPSCI